MVKTLGLHPPRLAVAEVKLCCLTITLVRVLYCTLCMALEFYCVCF